MKLLNIIVTFIFVLFAALQYNDPDPYIWVPIYLYAAILCWLAAKRKYYPGLYLLGMALYFLYALYLFFDKNGVISWASEHHAENIVQTMKAGKPWIEETREFGGLVLVFLALMLNWFQARKSIKKTG